MYLHRERRITVFEDPDAERKYLMLDELGQVLKHLSNALSRKWMYIWAFDNVCIVEVIMYYSCCFQSKKLYSANWSP